MESSIGAFIPGGPGVGGTTALVFHAVGLRLSGRQATWPCGQADGLGQGGVPAGEVAIISKPTPHGPVDARPAKRPSRTRVTRATPSTPPSHLWIPNGRAAIVPALHPPAHRLAHRCSCAGSYGRPVGAATWALLATEPRGRWKIPHSMAFLALPCPCRALWRPRHAPAAHREAAPSLQAPPLAADQASSQAAPKAEPFHLRHQPVAANPAPDLLCISWRTVCGSSPSYTATGVMNSDRRSGPVPLRHEPPRVAATQRPGCRTSATPWPAF
jgi:hypothetical protein